MPEVCVLSSSLAELITLVLNFLLWLYIIYMLVNLIVMSSYLTSVLYSICIFLITNSTFTFLYIEESSNLSFQLCTTSAFPNCLTMASLSLQLLRGSQNLGVILGSSLPLVPFDPSTRNSWELSRLSRICLLQPCPIANIQVKANFIFYVDLWKNLISFSVSPFLPLYPPTHIVHPPKATRMVLLKPKLVL